MAGRRILVITLYLALISPTLLHADQGECKRRLRDLLDRFHMAPAADLQKIAAYGDVFEAARQIVEEEATKGLQNDMVCRVALMILRDSNDPRARDVFLPFLRLSDWHDKRQQIAIDYVLKVHDSGGEAWVRSALESSSEAHQKQYLLQVIGMYGGDHWLEYLRRLPISPDERENGVGYWLGRTIAAIEKKIAKRHDNRPDDAKQPNHDKDSGGPKHQAGPEQRQKQKDAAGPELSPESSTTVSQENGLLPILGALVAICIAVAVLCLITRRVCMSREVRPGDPSSAAAPGQSADAPVASPLPPPDAPPPLCQ